MDMIAALPQGGEPGSEAAAGERGLEGKIDPCRGQVPHAGEHDASGARRHGFGTEGRQAGRNDVGIDELGDLQPVPLAQAG